MIPHLKDTASTLLLLGLGIIALALFKALLHVRRHNRAAAKPPQASSELDHKEVV